MAEPNRSLDPVLDEGRRMFRAGKGVFALSILIGTCCVIGTATTRFIEARLLYIMLGLFAELAIGLFYRNVRLILDSEGATYIDWLGRVAFVKPWSLIDRMGYLAETSDGRGRRLALVSGASHCELDSFSEVDEIAQIVRERAPQAKIEALSG